MKAKEAYDILKAKFETLDVVKCMEYDSRFVFLIVPHNKKETTNTRVMHNSICVVKDTKEIRDFKPFNIPIQEYRSGKEVVDFKV